MTLNIENCMFFKPNIEKIISRPLFTINLYASLK